MLDSVLICAEIIGDLKGKGKSRDGEGAELKQKVTEGW